MEGPKVPAREARSVSAEDVRNREWRSSPSPLVDLGLSPEKKFKNRLLNRIFCIFASEIVSPAVLARLSIMHYNCYLYGSRV